jgi:transposase
MPPHKTYPSDVGDDAWAFVAPFVSVLTRDAPQRKHDLRAVCNAPRSLAHTGAPGRSLPSDFPPWAAVSQQARRGLNAGGTRAALRAWSTIRASA